MVIRWLRQDFAAALDIPFTLQFAAANGSAGLQEAD
jgi:hypothetical protein